MAKTPPRLRRVDAMLGQLCQASTEFVEAKEEFDVARVTYETAREKFSTVRRLALGVLSRDEWWQWRIQHENVQYTGLRIGEAIAQALENRAFEAAEEVQADGARPFNPTMTLEGIQEVMERGGFEFRTTTPLREVNAALINLDRTKVQRIGNTYQAADADMIRALVLGNEEKAAEADETKEESVAIGKRAAKNGRRRET